MPPTVRSMKYCLLHSKAQFWDLSYIIFSQLVNITPTNSQKTTTYEPRESIASTVLPNLHTTFHNQFFQWLPKNYVKESANTCHLVMSISKFANVLIKFLKKDQI